MAIQQSQKDLTGRTATKAYRAITMIRHQPRQRRCTVAVDSFSSAANAGNTPMAGCGVAIRIEGDVYGQVFGHIEQTGKCEMSLAYDYLHTLPEFAGGIAV